MNHFLSMGVLLGLSAGLAPGPLLALVLSETLEHGVGAGIRVALAPLITDLPIVLIAVFLLSRFSEFYLLLGVISLVGSAVIFTMGLNGIRTSGITLSCNNKAEKSLARGVLVNFLSPHPYLFWISVGAPAVTRAMEKGLVAPLVFVGSFYILLVGSKVGFALAAGKSRDFLQGRAYIYTMRALGGLLCGLALLLLRDGLGLLGVI